MKLSGIPTVLFAAAIFLCMTTLTSAQTADQTGEGLETSMLKVSSPLSNWKSIVEPESRLKPFTEAGPTPPQIVLELTQLIVDLDSEVPLRSFFKPQTFEVHNGVLPAVDADSGTGKTSSSNIPGSINSTTKFASSCESVRRATPIMLAKLDDKGTQAMKAALGKTANGTAPTVVCFSGQTAVVKDVAYQPFVVGVKPLTKDGETAYQPILQTVENGLVTRIKPTIKDGKIDLTANLAHSKVSEVETFMISGIKRKNLSKGVMIQIPEQTLKHINLSTSLEDGETLFIDPRLQIESREKQDSKLPFSKAKSVSVNKQVYFLLKAQIVEPEKALNKSLTQSR